MNECVSPGYGLVWIDGRYLCGNHAPRSLDGAFIWGYEAFKMSFGGEPPRCEECFKKQE